jgi:hypothetical protein
MSVFAHCGQTNRDTRCPHYEDLKPAPEFLKLVLGFLVNGGHAGVNSSAHWGTFQHVRLTRRSSGSRYTGGQPARPTIAVDGLGVVGCFQHPAAPLTGLRAYLRA